MAWNNGPDDDEFCSTRCDCTDCVASRPHPSPVSGCGCPQCARARRDADMAIPPRGKRR